MSEQRFTQQDREIVEALLAGATFPTAPYIRRALNEIVALQVQIEQGEAEIRRLREGWDGWQRQALELEAQLEQAMPDNELPEQEEEPRELGGTKRLWLHGPEQSESETTPEET